MKSIKSVYEEVRRIFPNKSITISYEFTEDESKEISTDCSIFVDGEGLFSNGTFENCLKLMYDTIKGDVEPFPDIT